MVKNHLEKNISGYIGRLLREHFGKGPGNVICNVSGPYVTVHISNFLSPMEKSLIDSGQTVYVEKTRDLLIDSLLTEITAYIELNSGKNVKEFYYDWELQKKTGMMIAVLSSSTEEHLLPEKNDFKNSGTVNDEIIKISAEVQKPPENTYSFLLNSRTLLIIREGIFIELEKELIRLGSQEVLKLAKRNVEKRLLLEHKDTFEESLNAEVADFFVDWSFDKDKSLILFNLKPS
ncbi:DUF2294 domain-containing protein [Bacillus salacetis]|uniref:DUF2294 domain-containing protein n=1 Tax=Bacillus salacetis TaxID=2315464 RepID=UPI003B9F5AC2